MDNKRDEHSSYDKVNTVLDKMIELQKSENKVNFGKKCFVVTGCIASIIILMMLCVMFYKNSFSMESLISLLLAFFSIFISVFFYFKADEASNRFYETSYNFMKDVSVTLGKIEERFGEKLNSLNDKVSHLSVVKEEKKEELETAEDEKQKTIEALLQKTQLSDSERQRYRETLRKQDQQISALQHELARMKNIERMYNEAQINSKYDDIYQKTRPFLSTKEIKIMRSAHISDWPTTLKEKLHTLDLLDSDGDFTPWGQEFLDRMMR